MKEPQDHFNTISPENFNLNSSPSLLDKLANLDIENQQLKEKSENTERQLERSKQTIERMQAQISYLDKSMQHLKHQHTLALLSVNRADEAIGVLNEQINQLQNQYVQLLAENTNLRNQLNLNPSENRALEQEGRQGLEFRECVTSMFSDYLQKNQDVHSTTSAHTPN